MTQWVNGSTYGLLGLYAGWVGRSVGWLKWQWWVHQRHTLEAPLNAQQPRMFEIKLHLWINARHCAYQAAVPSVDACPVGTRHTPTPILATVPCPPCDDCNP
jgi:hypothetical protein